MFNRILLNALQARTVKELALRFSKELEALSGERIRGRKLYDAFAKVAGYGSFNEILHSLDEVNFNFIYNDYVEKLSSQLRKYLPSSCNVSDIETSLTEAKPEGALRIIVNGYGAADTDFALLRGSISYKQFLQHIYSDGRKQNVSFGEAASTYFFNQKQVYGPIEVFLDYSNWKNERDPLMSWEPLNSFIRMVFLNAKANNNIQIRVARALDEHNSIQVLKEINEHGVFVWEDSLPLQNVTQRPPIVFFPYPASVSERLQGLGYEY